MSRRARQAATTPSPGLIDSAIEWLLIALIAFMPIAFGAVTAWSEWVVIIVCSTLAALLVLKLLLRRDVPWVWSWAYIPIGVFLCMAFLQLVPLPAGLVAALSPQTVALKTSLLRDVPDA